jgi:DNA-binding transcriptional LysR family regulator
MIRLKDLKNFIEVSAFSSLSLASRGMGITQPALSESIGRLEKDLGIKLFYRTKNGISLTPQGRKTLDKAQHIQNTIHSLGSSEVETPTTVVLGCHAAVGSYFLPAFFSHIEKSAPGYKIQLKHDLSRNIQMEIQAGRIDVGVVVNAIPNPDLVMKKIAEDKICVWKAKSKTPQDQIIVDLSLFQSQNILKKWTQAPKKILATESLDLIARMTHQGCGYGIIPKRIVDLLDLDLKLVPNTPTYNDQLSVIHRPEFGKTPYEKGILSAIGQTFK